MSNNSYHYFATHLKNSDIIYKLEAGSDYENLEDSIQEKLSQLAKGYYSRDKSFSTEKYCLDFIESNKELLKASIDELETEGLKNFLVNYIGYSNGWNSSTRSYGKNSKKTANKISEQALIKEMTDPRASIKKLLDAARGNLSVVKPYLPAIMISLNTNTRDKSIMKFEHTGRFCFDIDKLENTNEALKWMNKIWKGTKNIKPYMAFVSPRGKGVKVFCKVDVTSKEFKKDLTLKDRKSVMKHHKIWYEGARKEIIAAFPELEEKFDESTKDPQRLTYIPFIADQNNHFKYDANKFSNYSIIAKNEKNFQNKELEKKIALKAEDIKKIKQEKNITSDKEAFKYLLKNKSLDFDVDFEKEKLIKTIDFIEDLATKDTRIDNWVNEKFNDYHTLMKISWPLYGVFGDDGIEQIKRLIPSDSNKLDENHGDHRWALKSSEDYSEQELANLTPAAFYKLVREQDKIKDYLNENYSFNSNDIKQFKILRDLYETYIRNKKRYENNEDEADLAEFMDELTVYLDKKRTRLPLIEQLENLEPEIQLEPNEYLNKNKMEDLLKKKHKDKRVFYLRSQCGAISLQCRLKMEILSNKTFEFREG